MVELFQYEDNKVVVIKLQGMAQYGDSRLIKEKLTEVSKHTHNVVVDFTDIQYIGSAVLGILATEVKKFRNLGGDIKLAGLAPSILRLFQITSLDAIFTIYPDFKSAMDSF